MTEVSWLRMGTRDRGLQPSWGSREGFWEVVMPRLSLDVKTELDVGVG